MCRYEQAKITTLIAETGQHFHVGLKYNSQTQSFEWVSGEEFTYSHWAEYEPGRFQSTTVRPRALSGSAEKSLPTHTGLNTSQVGYKVQQSDPEL
jgi:hypothetical protein